MSSNADTNATGESSGVFKSIFLPFIIKSGRGMNLLGVVLCFFPAICLAIQGIFPPGPALAAGLAIELPLVMSAYIYEPISYFAVLGIPGTYMSFLSGNISNLRVPAASVAQKAAGVEEGTEEGTIIATIGIAVSTFVNIVILSAGIFAGTWVLSLLPPKVTEALNLLLPALFAALTVNYVMQKPKLGLIGIPIALAMALANKYGLFSFLPSAVSGAVPVLACVFGTMAIGIAMARKGKM